MSDYSQNLRKMSHEDLADILAGGPEPGSRNHEIIKFEMHRRATAAQQRAAEATERSAVAAERYTRATWVLIVITVIGMAWSFMRSLHS